MNAKQIVILFSMVMLSAGCAGKQRVVTMDMTGYCNCGKCCGWERNVPDFWNKTITTGPNKGKPYTGLTSKGTSPHENHPGLFSFDSIVHPWMIPIRIIFFPWLFLPKDGTLAADTKYYPFGTRMYIPGYGWGIVEDRGSAIKGPTRIDVYFSTHGQALDWGRRKEEVVIEDKL